MARNLKERYGAVHPPSLQQRLGHSPLDMVEMRRRSDRGADVHVELDGGYSFTLGWERYVPGELLFTPHAAGLPTRPLHQLVCYLLPSCLGHLRTCLPTIHYLPTHDPRPTAYYPLPVSASLQP